MTLLSSYNTISLGLIIVRCFLPLNFFLTFVSKIIDKLTQTYTEYIKKH